MTALDPELHHPTRIAIVSRLMPHERLRFATLRELTALTPGNLASHLAALERAGYVEQRDALFRQAPGKLVAMTPRGREAFRAYVSALEAHLEALRTVRERAAERIT